VQDYTQAMRRVLAIALLAGLLALALPSLAAASNNPCRDNNGQPCRDAPEAPALVLYPLTAAAVIGGYLLLTRRHRRADQ
jgi:hypothetical protein